MATPPPACPRQMPAQRDMLRMVVDVVEVNVISLVSCFAVNNTNLAVVEVIHTDARTLDARNMKLLRASGEGGGGGCGLI